jgi:nicotinamidase/pyrazinamidase
MSASTLLLIIDAQFDFCHPEGALFVPGADQDVQRIVALLEAKGGEINDVIVTLDTHQVLDISHPGFWTDRRENHPVPFTSIRSSEVKDGKWKPLWEPEWVGAYLQKLESEGELSHYIWPEHCVLGTRGNALHDSLAECLTRRAHATGRNHLTVIKGLNPFTEHFGVFEAQVPMGGDPDTQLNQQLINHLGEYDRILICGEARSHCVATSLKQLLKYGQALLPRLVLLTDAMSDVAGLGHLADPIFEEARRRGVQFSLSTEV